MLAGMDLVFVGIAAVVLALYLLRRRARISTKLNVQN